MGEAAARVAGGGSDLKIALAEGDDVVGHQIAVGTLGAAGGRNRDPAAGPPLQHPGTGDVVGMDMSFERKRQPQAELLDQRSVPASNPGHRGGGRKENDFGEKRSPQSRAPRSAPRPAAPARTPDR